ncbi:NAD-dependent epimerase/dehydratase family protein [Plantactinospora sonchi]|uniref:NAD-dependent epimerase/dehydratase family protein n=1 Tax=Plantactinospora sonchi TaxID=1544735 RepID=A0ABU7RNY1_9ACTN
MRIAITGATGSVGSALLRRLSAERDIEVIGIARRCPKPDAGPPYDAVRWWHSADLGDPACLHPLAERLAGVDAVVHLAWQFQPGHERARLRRTNVNGTRHVVNAMLAADVPRLVYASSVATYAPGPKDRLVDESWPATGIGQRSWYSVDKATVETYLDGAERDYPGLRVVRMRKPLVVQREASAGVTRHLLGRLVPVSLFRGGRLPVVPRHRLLRVQVVHGDDVAEAYLKALLSDRTGAFNIAAEPVLDGPLVAAEVGGLAAPLPLPLLRLLARAAWRSRLVPADEGWLELSAAAPLMDCSRAERELDWRPRHNAVDALRELLAGIADGVGTRTPPIRQQAA